MHILQDAANDFHKRPTASYNLKTIAFLYNYLMQNYCIANNPQIPKSRYFYTHLDAQCQPKNKK